VSLYEIEQAGRETVVGKLRAIGGAPGDVPTQQSNGELVQAPGGGSMPSGVLLKTYTAAEIADRWEVVSGVGYAALPLTEIVEGQWVGGFSEIANTLDQSVVTDVLIAYDPGASTADVENNGTQMGATSLANDVEPYATTIIWPTSGGGITSVSIVFLAVGKQAYLMFFSGGGTDAPTTGEITVAIFGS